MQVDAGSANDPKRTSPRAGLFVATSAMARERHASSAAPRGRGWEPYDPSPLQQIEALKTGRIDIGFGRVRRNDAAVERTVLREERLVLAVAPGTRLAASDAPVAIADLAGEELIVYPKGQVIDDEHATLPVILSHRRKDESRNIVLVKTLLQELYATSPPWLDPAYNTMTGQRAESRA